MVMKLVNENLNVEVGGCIYGIYHDEMNLLVMKYGIRYGILIYGIWGEAVIEGRLGRLFGEFPGIVGDVVYDNINICMLRYEDN